jgi:hypothetical protein
MRAQLSLQAFIHKNRITLKPNKNTMKLTERKLRGIIREEISRLTENKDAMVRAVKKASQQVIDLEYLDASVNGNTTTHRGETVVFIENHSGEFGLEIGVNEGSIEIMSDPGYNTGRMEPDVITVNNPQDIMEGGSKFNKFLDSFVEQLRFASSGYGR